MRLPSSSVREISLNSSVVIVIYVFKCAPKRGENIPTGGFYATTNTKVHLPKWAEIDGNRDRAEATIDSRSGWASNSALRRLISSMIS